MTAERYGSFVGISSPSQVGDLPNDSWRLVTVGWVFHDPSAIVWRFPEMGVSQNSIRFMGFHRTYATNVDDLGVPLF